MHMRITGSILVLALVSSEHSPGDSNIYVALRNTVLYQKDFYIIKTPKYLIENNWARNIEWYYIKLNIWLIKIYKYDKIKWIFSFSLREIEETSYVDVARSNSA